jgi:CheY-like chemotaxis protein
MADYAGLESSAPEAPSILVVDDEPQVLSVLRYSLENEGYRVRTANDGIEAMLEVADHRPSVMLLDLMMPTMDGWAVLDELAKIPRARRPVVIVVSALSSLRDRARAAELGADAYIAKPFDVDELLEVLGGLRLAV